MAATEHPSGFVTPPRSSSDGSASHIEGQARRGHIHPVDADRVAHAKERLPSAEDAGRLTSLLSLMADPVRLRLVYALDVSEELCVGDLAIALEVSEDAVSYGLKLLRTAGLVVTRKQGRVVFNRLAEDFPAPLRDHCLRQLVAITRRS